MKIINYVIVMIYAFCCGASFYSPILRIGNATLFDLLSLIYIALNWHSAKTIFYQYRKLFAYLTCFVSILLFSSLFNSIFIYKTTTSIISLIRYPVFILIFVVFYDFISKSKNSIHYVIWPFALGIIYISISQWIYAYALGITVFQTGEQFQLFGLDYLYDQSKLTRSYIAINPNDIGVVSAMIYPLLYLIISDSRQSNSLIKIIVYFLITYFLVTMYFTGQKTGMIPVFILVAFILYDQIYPINPYKISFIFCLTIALIFFTPQNIFNFEIESIINYVNARFSRIDSITSRLELKVMALEIFSSNPIFGAGQDGFQIKYGINNPHDWNFQVLSETGLIGFFFYLIIMIYIAKIIQNNYGNKFLLLYMSIFIIVSSAGGSNFNAHPFWVTVSFLASYNIYIQNKQLL